ncbi:MAG TPA: hypothetical protein VD816_01745 [Ohtaekwangia sp.]|nr:hypothetical protein [Ohtaekwangia sp.]
MTKPNQKHEILESLDSLDQGQTEKVLAYIQALRHTSSSEADHKRLKQRAMKEIRQALGSPRTLRPSF